MKLEQIIREVKNQTVAYRFGRPPVRKGVTDYGIAYYYSPDSNVTVYAETLRDAQIAAKRG